MFQLAWVVVERNLEGDVDFVRRIDAKRMKEKPGVVRVRCPKIADLDAVNTLAPQALSSPVCSVVRLLMTSKYRWSKTCERGSAPLKA